VTILCAPWATTGDLPLEADRPVLPAGRTWTAVLVEASEQLFLLSGQQWVGESTVTVAVRPAGEDVYAPLTPGWVPLPVPLYGPALAGWAWRGRELAVVALPAPPVVAIDAVLIDGVELDPSDYEARLPAGLLERTDRRSWPVDGTLAVTYRHGQPPPEGGKRAAVALALELGKAYASDASCRLRNIQTLTREGVTMAAVNVREALDKGQTGLFEVDQWLASVNPHHAPRRASVWSPDFGRTRRVPTP
jgi:hypothetical protein